MEQLKIFKEYEHILLPGFATPGSAAFDIRAYLSNVMVTVYDRLNEKHEVPVASYLELWPSCRALIPTGLIFDIPQEHVLKVFARSGLSAKYGLTLSNGVGIIDSDYVEPLFVIVQNNTDAPVIIQHGERIAQCILEKTLDYTITEIKTKPEQKTTRDGGFGSTGKV
jgi:dUTP pyrophosphatase